MLISHSYKAYQVFSWIAIASIVLRLLDMPAFYGNGLLTYDLYQARDIVLIILITLAFTSLFFVYQYFEESKILVGLLVLQIIFTCGAAIHSKLDNDITSAGLRGLLLGAVSLGFLISVFCVYAKEVAYLFKYLGGIMITAVMISLFTGNIENTTGIPRGVISTIANVLPTFVILIINQKMVRIVKRQQVEHELLEQLGKELNE